MKCFPLKTSSVNSSHLLEKSLMESFIFLCSGPSQHCDWINHVLRTYFNLKNLMMPISTIIWCTQNEEIHFSLKELRNRISRIIRLWSLFCSILVYASLHFLPIPLENKFLSFCAFCLFCLLCVELDVIFINFIA